MSRRPPIDLAAYHHVMNHGVNRSDICIDDGDYNVFLGIVCKACRAYDVVLHDYCLMSKHFYFLVETQRDNLSLFMKHVNSNYVICANKKQKCFGYFWQERFYSRYINFERYYYTLGAVIANKQAPPPCTLQSKLLVELDFDNIQELIGVKLDEEDAKTLEDIEKQKVLSCNGVHSLAFSKTIFQHFNGNKRNYAIMLALKDGYTQASVAKHLRVSKVSHLKNT